MSLELITGMDSGMDNHFSTIILYYDISLIHTTLPGMDTPRLIHIGIPGMDRFTILVRESMLHGVYCPYPDDESRTHENIHRFEPSGLLSRQYGLVWMNPQLCAPSMDELEKTLPSGHASPIDESGAPNLRRSKGRFSFIRKNSKSRVIPDSS